MMEREINNQQKAIQGLIVQKAFKDLSKNEKIFVLDLLTEQDYSLRRKVITESKDVYAVPAPKPLVLENKKAMVIPLYQAFSGIAAAVIAMFFIMNSQGQTSNIGEHSLLAVADTVYVNNVSVDTVVEYRTEYKDRIVYRTANNENFATVNEKDPDDGVFPSFELPDLSTLKLENHGSTALNDNALVFVNDF